jgi:hypothetical protein
MTIRPEARSRCVPSDMIHVSCLFPIEQLECTESPMSPACPRREQAMQISKIVTDGSARDEALKRRNNAMREALGMKPAPSRNASESPEPRADEKPAE